MRGGECVREGCAVRREGEEAGRKEREEGGTQCGIKRYTRFGR